MSKYVPDASSHRWVLIATSRTSRDENYHTNQPKKCIFCEGNEELTPREVYRTGSGEPNTKGWKVRVISNKFPITDIHEVVIHSPHHEHDFEEFHHSQSEGVFKVYRDRFEKYRAQGQVLIFNNHGAHAGASQAHPHSQIVVVPHQINLDSLTREPIQNVILDTAHFSMYCPDYSEWPYEVWIAPKKDSTFFGDITDVEIEDLSLLMKRIIRVLNHIYSSREIFAKVDRKTNPFGYNFYIYPGIKWYLRIIPRFVHRAGFEFGTGLSVNVVDPTDAAEELLEHLG